MIITEQEMRIYLHLERIKGFVQNLMNMQQQNDLKKEKDKDASLKH